MVVALRAVQPRAEKKLGGVLGALHRRAVGAIPVGRRVGVSAAARGDEFARELIERLVRGDALVNPAVKRLHPLRIKLALLNPQQVGPLERPEIDELRAFQQRLDELGALVGRGVGGKCARLVAGGNQAEQIKISAAQKNFISAPAGRIHPQRPQFREHLRVDEIVLRRIAPFEIGPLRHEGQPHGRLLFEKADDHRGFTRTLAGHPALGRNIHEQIRRVIDRETGNIALRAVRENCTGLQLHFALRFDEHLRGRRDVEPRELGRGAAVILPACGDPARERVPGGRVRAEALPAFVRKARGGLEEHEAACRGEQVDAPPGLFAGEREPVEIGVLAAEGKFEAALAIRIAVAGAGVAAGLGQQRHHVVAK